MNEFTRLISSPMMNVDHIYRYSGTKLVEPETLANHIYETMMLGYMVCKEIKKLNPDTTLDPLKYLEKALHHDMEESMTGDVARPLKYHNSEVKHQLNLVADEVAQGLYSEYFSDYEYNIWNTAKEGYEGLVLKIADMLTVTAKVVKEVDYLNNLYFLRVAYEVSQYLSDLKASNALFQLAESVRERCYLKDLLDSAEEHMQSILKKHEEDLTIYRIKDRSVLVSTNE